MPRVAYVYIPRLSRTEAREVFLALEPYGFRVSHIDKRDPPRKRYASYDEAAEIIVLGNGDITNWTFVRDEKSAVDLTFEVRDDPRWGFSTVSLSFPNTIPVRDLCDDLFERLSAFACVSGVEGAGKGQPWEVCRTSAECPEQIRGALGWNA